MLFCWIKRCVFGAIAWVGRLPLSNEIEGAVTFCTRAERAYEWHVVVRVLVIARVSLCQVSLEFASCLGRGDCKLPTSCFLFESASILTECLSLSALSARCCLSLDVLCGFGFRGCVVCLCSTMSRTSRSTSWKWWSVRVFVCVFAFGGSLDLVRATSGLQHCACQSRKLYTCWYRLVTPCVL